MHNTLQKWLKELDDEVAVVHSSEINEEANGNMVTFGISQEALDEWGQEAVVAFLEACRDLYKSKSGGISMQFYSWYDEQAGQLRICAVSSVHGRLPFRCQLANCGLSEMVAGLFSGHSGLYDDEARLNIWQSGI